MSWVLAAGRIERGLRRRWVFRLRIGGAVAAAHQCVRAALYSRSSVPIPINSAANGLTVP
ncbi:MULTISPECIES: hypothetical protein [Streptomyces]|uniref:hypothetical protein n=1 Tax=Streptomyces TaxID=1883 RepID=UPI001E34BF60|nr:MULTISPECIES: hypothetical protein [Streptomyces]UFQ18245.1 hypothetical protein J2N69_26405 [Streptomyces huasconensis]WCL87858.1 hypothetical protein PPN52_26400 [Streptomyces sp. JCM 35825]